MTPPAAKPADRVSLSSVIREVLAGEGYNPDRKKVLTIARKRVEALPPERRPAARLTMQSVHTVISDVRRGRTKAAPPKGPTSACAALPAVLDVLANGTPPKATPPAARTLAELRAARVLLALCDHDAGRAADAVHFVADLLKE